VIELDEKKHTRKDEILRAAAKVIASKGFASATVRDIAEASGILSGSLYHHFRSKDQILVEILQGMLGTARTTYQVVAQRQLAPQESVHELLRSGFEVLDGWQTEIRILQNDFPYLAQITEFQFVIDAQNEIEQIWVNEVKRGIAANVFSRDVDPGLAYRVMMGSILNAGRWYRKGVGLSPTQMGDLHAEFFLHGLMHATK
jgi:AcrR family transcriptional regulator